MEDELVKAAQNALLVLAVLKITDTEKPYVELSRDFMKVIIKAHDDLLEVLKP